MVWALARPAKAMRVESPFILMCEGGRCCPREVDDGEGCHIFFQEDLEVILYIPIVPLTN